MFIPLGHVAVVVSQVKRDCSRQHATKLTGMEWSIIVGGLVKIFIFKSFCAIKSRRETSCYSLNYMLPGACYPDVAENLTRAFEFWASAPRVTGKIMCLELLIDWLRKIIRLLDSFLKNIFAIVGGENIYFRFFSFLFPIHIYVQTALFPKFWYFVDSIRFSFLNRIVNLTAVFLYTRPICSPTAY